MFNSSNLTLLTLSEACHTLFDVDIFNNKKVIGIWKCLTIHVYDQLIDPKFSVGTCNRFDCNFFQTQVNEIKLCGLIRYIFCSFDTKRN